MKDDYDSIPRHGFFDTFADRFIRSETSGPTSGLVSGYMVPNPLRDLDYESARDATPVWYGVSSGNGNDGVSHHYPDYYVRTADPYRLAELAMVDTFKAGEGMAWAREAVGVDGERDYTISATIYEGPDGETEFGAAWLIIEVFPVESDSNGPLHSNGPEYDNLESAFSAEALALVPCG